MKLRILSFFIEGITWRVAQTPSGYFHHGPTTMPEWNTGIPLGVTLDTVESTFQQFPMDDKALQPTHVTFKLTYRVGHSNIECFVFSSSENDLFSVKISPGAFTQLQDALSYNTKTIPRMRVARVAIEQAIALGLPEVELEPGTPVFEKVKSQLGTGPPQKTFQ